jgi:hypothetical protein
MARCFSWAGAAAEYEALYRHLIGPSVTTARSAPRTVERQAPSPVAEALVPAA